MQSGTVLGGKYRLISLLGSGGMGTVWRAEHLGLRAPIAVKLLGPGISPTPEALARFHREAQSAANLRSPHVVQILDHGVDQATDTPFIAMELLEGESLAERLARTGRLTTAETMRVATHVARALTRAHELSIVHRDLKPGNIFLVSNEDEETVKVLDFGLAKWDEASHSGGVATVTGTFVGTAYYMSPEQVAGEKADHLSDLWALGVVVYECLTGRRPFEADNVVALALQISRARFTKGSSLAPISEEYDLWIERALAADPRVRFQSAREMADQLRRVETKAPTSRSELERQAPPPPLPPPAATPAYAPSPMEQTVGCFDADGNVIPALDGDSLPVPAAETSAPTAASVDPSSRNVPATSASAKRRRLGMAGVALGSAAVAVVGALSLLRSPARSPVASSPSIEAPAVPSASFGSLARSAPALPVPTTSAQAEPESPPPVPAATQSALPAPMTSSSQTRAEPSTSSQSRPAAGLKPKAAAARPVAAPSVASAGPKATPIAQDVFGTRK